MTRRAPSIAWLLFLALTLVASHADAQRRSRRSKKKTPNGPKIALIGVSFEGDASPALSTEVQRAVSEGLWAADFKSMNYDELLAEVGDADKLLSCKTVMCLQDLTETVDAAKFIRMSLEAQSKFFTIRMLLLSADVVDGIERRYETTCNTCTTRELRAKITEAARELMQGAGEAPRDIQITTSPEGGTLTLNSRELGPAPYSGKLFPGTYAVGAALEGYEPATQEVTVGAGGEPIVVKVELTKIPDPDKPDPDPDPTPDPQTPDLIDGPVGRPFRTAKWVGVGVTGAALVAAGVSLFFDGRGTCDLNPPQEECPEVYDTQNVTIGAGIGALVVGGLSIWMFLRDGSDARRQAAWEEQERERAKKKAEPAVSLTPGGAIGGVRFRF